MKRTVKQFDSIFALANFVKTNQNNFGSLRHDVLHSPAQMSFNETLERAENGGYWPEGAAKIKPVEMDLDSLNVHGMNMPRPEAAVIGYRPNVAAYLAGSPLSMVRMTPFHQPNRLVRVAVAVGKQWDVSAATTFARGNGILSVLNALHGAGFNIEIWALWRNHDDSRKHEVSIETCIKSSTDSYSPDSIAFGLCNDAFQRRLSWAAAGICSKISDDKRAFNSVINDGLGSGRGAEYEDYDVSFPWVTDADRWNDSNAVDKARTITEKQLNANLVTTGE